MTQNKSRLLLLVVALYVPLVALYFLPVPLPRKLALPVAWLSLAAVWQLPRAIALGLICSAVGDYAATCGSLPVQMVAFALAHVAFVWYFVGRLRADSAWHWTAWRIAVTVAALAVLTLACVCVVPRVPHAGLSAGVVVYALLVILMAWAAQWQRCWMFALGGAFFLLSDFALGWHRFVEPLPMASPLIMIPYYGAQLLLFIGARGSARTDVS